VLDLSVVVVSYNTIDLLRECLATAVVSLASPGADGLRLEYELFVVDNASVDGSVAMVAEEFPQAKLIANDTNRGFAAANNQALAQATGRYYLLLNPDTEVIGDALPSLVAFMDDHPKAGAAGARLENPDRTFQHSAFRFPTLWMSFFDFFPLNHRVVNSRLNGRYPRSKYTRPFQIDHPLGACMIVRAEAAAQVGLLDERFFMYCEEIDWCMRIKQAGWEIWCTPDSGVVHHVGASARQFRGPMLVELHRSRQRLFAKHYSPAFQSRHKAIVRFGLRRQALLDWWAVVRGRLSRAEFAERLAAYGEIWGL
jgi:N-acetylglucosaminyl-diphospho-decaprenol L-rhamnosyltransferase